MLVYAGKSTILTYGARNNEFVHARQQENGDKRESERNKSK